VYAYLNCILLFMVVIQSDRTKVPAMIIINTFFNSFQATVS
jgi:hypothetical protein